MLPFEALSRIYPDEYGAEGARDPSGVRAGGLSHGPGGRDRGPSHSDHDRVLSAWRRPAGVASLPPLGASCSTRACSSTTTNPLTSASRPRSPWPPACGTGAP